MMTEPGKKPLRLLRMHEVEGRVGLKRARIYPSSKPRAAFLGVSKFPSMRRALVEHEIEAYITARIAARDAAGGEARSAR